MQERESPVSRVAATPLLSGCKRGRSELQSPLFLSPLKGEPPLMSPTLTQILNGLPSPVPFLATQRSPLLEKTSKHQMGQLAARAASCCNDLASVLSDLSAALSAE